MQVKAQSEGFLFPIAITILLAMVVSSCDKKEGKSSTVTTNPKTQEILNNEEGPGRPSDEGEGIPGYLTDIITIDAGETGSVGTGDASLAVSEKTFSSKVDVKMETIDRGRLAFLKSLSQPVKVTAVSAEGIVTRSEVFDDVKIRINLDSDASGISDEHIAVVIVLAEGLESERYLLVSKGDLKLTVVDGVRQVAILTREVNGTFLVIDSSDPANHPREFDPYVPAPPNPIDLSAVSNSTTSIKLSWKSAGGSTSAFMLSYGQAGVAPRTCLDGKIISRSQLGTAKEWNFTDLIANVVYSFRLCALNKLEPPDYSPGSVITQATDAPDITPPPPLAGFSGATGLEFGRINISLVFPPTVSDFSLIKIRRQAGVSAPADCSSGTDAITITSFAEDVTIKDNTGDPEGFYSYRACIYDQAGNLTTANIAQNIQAKPKKHRIFVSSLSFLGGDFSKTYKGQIFNSGAAGADYRCQDLANLAGLSGTWRALLGTKEHTAKNRLAVNGPITNIGSDKIADDRIDLWDGSLDSNIGNDENGVFRNSTAWTGFADIGDARSNCNNWTEDGSSPQGVSGLAVKKDYEWAVRNVGAHNCDWEHALYCIDQHYRSVGLTVEVSPNDDSKVKISLDFADQAWHYQTVEVIRTDGAVLPSSDCTTSPGTSIKYLTAPFSNIEFEDNTGVPGRYTYRACVTDLDGNVLSSLATSRPGDGFIEIFRTTKKYTGNLTAIFNGESFATGIQGADARCQRAADLRGLGGDWLALISDSITNNTTNAVDRLGANGPAIKDMLGVKVFDNAVDAFSFDGSGITFKNEYGENISGDAWSGSTGAGQGGTNTDCTNWTSNATNGNYAGSGNPWFFTGTKACSGTSSLLCFQ